MRADAVQQRGTSDITIIRLSSAMQKLTFLASSSLEMVLIYNGNLTSQNLYIYNHTVKQQSLQLLCNEQHAQRFCCWLINS